MLPCNRFDYIVVYALAHQSRTRATDKATKPIRASTTRACGSGQHVHTKRVSHVVMITSPANQHMLCRVEALTVGKRRASCSLFRLDPRNRLARLHGQWLGTFFPAYILP
jgi:hypothetical protein